ncbi:solute carrier family 25 member 45-like isoform X3 [Lingula anatina]|nr:solute carrier family 25 member 45-like isoform X3 [Lingula anatina]|eukprot:XP_013406148.1 solute carrier family 25 member 45-like isoform X3 [Lingula anatina]
MQTQLAGHHYKGTWDAIKNIYHHGLGRGFFRGLSFPLVSYGAINSVFFGVYGNSLRWLHPDTTTQPSYRDIYIAGCIGGTAQLAIACPVDVVKVVLQSQIPHGNEKTRSGYFKGPLECMSSIYRQCGIKGMYRGMYSMAWRDIPAYGLYLLVYEAMYDGMQRTQLFDKHGIFASLFAGGWAGVISWSVIIPFDVIKSRIQADMHGLVYKSTTDCIRKTYQEGGYRIFFTGLVVTAIRGFPTCAVTFLGYSQALRYLNQIHAEPETICHQPEIVSAEVVK